MVSKERAALKESNVDVLIIGAGPAGYMAALWFARLGVNARIIDKRSSRIFAGQADGLQPRVLEVFETFGFADRALKEVAIGWEACFYEPDESGRIRRVETIPEGVPGISRFNGSVIHQGRIETWITDAIDEFSGGALKVERPKLPESLEMRASSEQDEYPLRVEVKTLQEDSAMPEQYGNRTPNGLYRQFGADGEAAPSALPEEDREIIRAKYVLGTDGAHSWVRKQLGIEHQGETSDFVWGVLDIVPITDFPDIRRRSSIHSQNNGSVMLIPREDNLVRLYIQLREAEFYAEDSQNGTSPPPGQKTTGRVDRSKMTADHILKTAQSIFEPYSLEAAEIRWFTAYQVGQRVTTEFNKDLRVFIAGDACHTHSPKAGQGMNVSMMDTFNLAWKLGYVVKGLAHPRILSTYELERRTVAKDLIAYDQKLTRLFSSKPGDISTQEFRSVIETGTAFTTGCTVNYDDSLLIDKPANQSRDSPYYSPLATNLAIGMRLPDVKLVMQSDGRPWFFNQRLPSTGHFRLLLFIGDFAQVAPLKMQMNQIGDYLAGRESFAKQLDSILQPMLIHASPRSMVEWDDFPAMFRQRDERGLMDYWKIFADSPCYHDKTTGQAYEEYGIKKDIGAAVVLRPDGYVAKVVEPTVDGIKDIGDWFAVFIMGLEPSIRASL